MLKSQILRGTSWLLAGRFVSNALGLASTLIAARLLVPEDFGLMAIAMSVFAIAGSVVELPVGAALVQMKTAGKDDFDTAWTINLLRGAIVAALMIAAAWPATLMTGDPRLFGLVTALAAYPLVLGLRNSWFEQYIRDMDFRREALLDVLTKITSITVIVWIGLATRSYWALPLGLIASGLANTAASYLLRPQLPAFGLKSFRKFFGFSVWVGLGNVADSVRDASTNFLLGRFLGNARLGAFSVGSQFGERLETLLYAPMERTLFAAFSSIQDDAARVREVYLKSIHAGFAIILPVCAGMGLLAPEIIGVALGPNWREAALVLTFAAPITALYLLAGLSNSLANALGHPRALFRFKALSAALHVPVLAAGVISFGMTGALWACAFTALGWYLCSIHVVAKVTGLTHLAQIAVVGRTAVSALAMSGVVVSARTLLFAGSGDELADLLLRAGVLATLGALTYVTAHFALWQASGRHEGIETNVLSVLNRRIATL
ncbi:lipopolysaccharide biosynthesis protein [Hyphomonas sp.]|uniref:lipopolysaccharide biosynthesis protein n=1 Tax=Hyphomonas sp. TaxID=87 RepID=UPI003918C782